MHAGVVSDHVALRNCMLTRHIAVCYENYKAVCFIANSGMTTVVVSMVTRHIANCTKKKYERKKNDAFELCVWRKIRRVSWTERKKIAENETKHLVRSYDKNVENSMFRTRDEGTSILGERYNAGNNCRSKEKREAPYAVDGRHQKCNWTLGK